MTNPFNLPIEVQVTNRIVFSSRRHYCIENWIQAFNCKADYATNMWVKEITMVNDAELVVCGENY